MVRMLISKMRRELPSYRIHKKLAMKSLNIEYEFNLTKYSFIKLFYTIS